MADPLPPQVSLRALREQRGLTLDELAQAIRAQGVSITTGGLNNAELGHRPPSELVLNAWLHALGTRRELVRTGPEVIEWVNAVRDEHCTCRAGLPRNRRARRTVRAAA